MEKKISPNLTLFALAINAFAIGSTEFISVGLLPMIVKSFHISLSQAGLTVSLYALGDDWGAVINNFDRKMESSLINAGDYASFH